MTIRRLTVAAAMLLTLAGCGGKPAETAAPATAATPAASATATTPASSARPTPTFCPNGRLFNGDCAGGTLAASTIAAPTGAAWETCDPSKDALVDPTGCVRDFDRDPCQTSRYSESEGDLLDAYIENKFLIDPAKLAGCPKYLPVWKQAQTGFTDGTYAVPSEVKPGTYQTTAHLTGGKVTDCYWERSTDGRIVDNNFVTGSVRVTVTIRSSDDTFVSRGCGDWVKA